MKNTYENLDSQAKTCFNSLPTILQEQIMQSGIEMTTKEQIETYCRNVLGKEITK